MVSTQTNQKFLSRNIVTQYDFDPGDTNADDIAWVDMRDAGVFTCSFFRTIGTGALTFQILANSASDGSGSDVVVKTWSGSQPDAVGDYVFLECTAQELAALGTDLRYVTASCAVATGTDEGVVTYIRSDLRFPRQDATADTVA